MQQSWHNPLECPRGSCVGVQSAGLIESGPLACNTHEVVNEDGEMIVAEIFIESAQG